VHWLSLIIALAERLARYYLKVAIMTHYRKDTPQWLNEAIFYQIMPDRFARETAGSQNADRELMKWDARPGSSGRGGTEFYGGNLQGICAQLDHIAALGVNAILLTPINRAPSYHRYDAVDFCALDPLLGDWKDLERLVSEAHKRGLKLVFDIALNHVSVEHPWFQKALKDPKSKERSWFKFDKKGNYQCWWGYHTLPELQLNNPELQQMLFLGKSNVLAFWLDKGFDGIRLDCANDLTHETCDQIVESIRPRYPQAAIIGELCTYSVPWLRLPILLARIGSFRCCLRTIYLEFTANGAGRPRSCGQHAGCSSLCPVFRCSTTAKNSPCAAGQIPRTVQHLNGTNWIRLKQLLILKNCANSLSCAENLQS
jgi:hypothetical protein